MNEDISLEPIPTKISAARFFFINEVGNLSILSSVEDAISASKNGGYFWLDYCDPTRTMLTDLIPKLGLHPLSIEDCLDEDQLPKLDVFPDYAFMIFNIFEIIPDGIKTHELNLFIGKNYLISVSHHTQKGDPLLKGIEREIERESGKTRLGPSFLMHLLVDTVVDHKFLAINHLEEHLDENEDQIINNNRQFEPSELMAIRRDLMSIRKSLFHEREVVGKIIRQDSPFITEKSLIYFRDVYDHLSKYYEISETARDQVTSLMEIHLSMISNRMAETSNRTNIIMRRLTLITTIFMPLTLISGIGGMSEFTMMVGQQYWRIGYFVLILVMVVIASINYALLKRMENKLPEDDLSGQKKI